MNQTTHQHHQIDSPPTIALQRKARRTGEEEKFFSSTEIIVKLRQRNFDDIVRRAALIRPLPNPAAANSPTPNRGGASMCGERQRKGEKFWSLSRRLRDIWPFGRTRGGKVQAWG